MGSSAGASVGSKSDISSGREVVSLLDRLKSPSPADIARLRKTKTNEPPRGKRKCRGALVSDLSEHLCLIQRRFLQVDE